MEWLPIETAPKDGTWILIGGSARQPQEYDPPNYDLGYHEYGSRSLMMFVGHWADGKYTSKFTDQWDDYYGPECPTHWMPLPKAPE